MSAYQTWRAANNIKTSQLLSTSYARNNITWLSGLATQLFNYLPMPASLILASLGH